MNSFLFLSTFYVFLKRINNYFFSDDLLTSFFLGDCQCYCIRCGAYEFLFSRFSVFLNYTMWSSNLFSASSYFSRFSWPRFFRVQIFQGRGFLGSIFFWVKVQYSGPGFRVALVGAEAVVRKCSVKTIFLKILRTPRKIHVFSCKLCEIFLCAPVLFFILDWFWYLGSYDTQR